jgi:hypothetical protein
MSVSINSNNKNSKIFTLFNLITKRRDPGRELVCNALSDSMKMVMFTPYVLLWSSANMTTDLHASRYWWRPGPDSMHKGYKKLFARFQRFPS